MRSKSNMRYFQCNFDTNYNKSRIKLEKLDIHRSFLKKINLRKSLNASLKFLEKEGYLILSSSNHNPSRIKIEVNKDDLYEFQVKNNKFDLFLKTILRSYTGLFEDYVKINEFEISKRLKTSREKVTKALQYLSNVEIISYLEQTDLPQITYLTERLSSKNIQISPLHYRERKEIAVKKIEKRNDTYIFILVSGAEMKYIFVPTP